MNRKCKAIIKKMSLPLDVKLNYNVQLWYEFTDSTTGRTGFVYAGQGKYCETIEQAKQYAKENASEIELEEINNV